MSMAEQLPEVERKLPFRRSANCWILPSSCDKKSMISSPAQRVSLAELKGAGRFPDLRRHAHGRTRTNAP